MGYKMGYIFHLLFYCEPITKTNWWQINTNW